MGNSAINMLVVKTLFIYYSTLQVNILFSRAMLKILPDQSELPKSHFLSYTIISVTTAIFVIFFKSLPGLFVEILSGILYFRVSRTFTSLRSALAQNSIMSYPPTSRLRTAVSPGPSITDKLRNSQQF